jgi:hypothetical protein
MQHCGPGKKLVAETGLLLEFGKFKTVEGRGSVPSSVENHPTHILRTHRFDVLVQRAAWESRKDQKELPYSFSHLSLIAGSALPLDNDHGGHVAVIAPL